VASMPSSSVEGLDDKTPAGNGPRSYPRSRDRARRKILTCGCPDERAQRYNATGMHAPMMGHSIA
jgi:hypothetical protein